MQNFKISVVNGVRIPVRVVFDEPVSTVWILVLNVADENAPFGIPALKVPSGKPEKTVFGTGRSDDLNVLLGYIADAPILGSVRTVSIALGQRVNCKRQEK